MKRLAAIWILAASAVAHVGSPDVYFDGKAGAYPVFVTIRPPAVIPGVAEIELRTPARDVTEMRITPLPLTGDAAKFAPAPDIAQRSKEDAGFYTGALWMMTTGSWQVRVQVDGARGRGEFSVPVPAVAQRTLGMDAKLGTVLFLLMLLLVVGAVSIAGAAAREAQLAPGLEPDESRQRRGRRVMATVSILVAAVVVLGHRWWTAEANAYDRYIYKPLEMSATVESGNQLSVKLSDPGWIRMRVLDDLIPDHNHLMHLFVVRVPQLDRVWHLHPDQRDTGVFSQKLPDMPAGDYELFADIVHRSGFPETSVGKLTVPEIKGSPLEGDDSAGMVGASMAGGYRMVFDAEPGGYVAKKPSVFRFRILDAKGEPARDLELYMGMPGHAVFLKKDRKVFAHLHPIGSVPMAALALTREAQANPHAGHNMGDAAPGVVGFPYGFPEVGEYRIFAQMKRAGRVETGTFDVTVK